MRFVESEGAHLDDLIAGVTPTFVDWTNDPTDGADITDGDISTFCTTGNKVAGGGYQYAYFEWDLGSFYDVFATGHGCNTTTVGTPYIYIFFYDGSSWKQNGFWTMSSTTAKVFNTSGAKCSKIRLAIAASTAATIAPNIREFHVWRL